MQNLNQIRAKSAWRLSSLDVKGEKGGDRKGVISKLPTMIIQNGLLATLASAAEKQGYRRVFDIAAEHCCSRNIVTAHTCADLLKELRDGDSDKLREVSAEIMAWLVFAKRVPYSNN